jgi:photosystem II stability/assembly factor-like uncharacterized protein
MKKIYVPFAIALLFVFWSCNKDEPTPEPVAPKLDTLTTGWTKIIVDSLEGFSDIFFKNNTTGYLVGGKTYKSTDGGLHWNPISDKLFYNLAVTNNGNVFFANETGLFRSINGTGPITQVLSSLSYSDVFFVDDDNGYYLNESGLFNSTDGGSNWVKLSTTGIDFPGYHATLFFTTKNTGWVTGSDTVFKTNASPLNWTGSGIVNKIPSTLFTSVFATPDNTVYALGGSYATLYKSTNGGASFSSIKTFQPVGGWYGDIYFVDNSTGYVLGNNRIYKTTDAGNTWKVAVSLADTHSQLVELHFSDAHHGWACSDHGTVLVYNN